MNLELLQKRAPASLQMMPSLAMSSKYVFIPTLPVLERLGADGWEVADAKQTKARNPLKEPYHRHMIRLRNNQMEPIMDPRNTIAKKLHMEIILINGHDGSATYTIHAGLFSFVCCNGLIVGSMLASIRVRHMGMAATLEAVSNGAAQLISEEMPKLGGAVEQMQGRLLSKDQQLDFAKHALALRYTNTTPVITADQLLDVHREEDAANDVWTTLNVIQENVLSRKHMGRSFNGRATSIRGVGAVRETVNINRGLWDHAMRLAA